MLPPRHPGSQIAGYSAAHLDYQSERERHWCLMTEGRQDKQAKILVQIQKPNNKMQKGDHFFAISEGVNFYAREPAYRDLHWVRVLSEQSQTEPSDLYSSNINTQKATAEKLKNPPKQFKYMTWEAAVGFNMWDAEHDAAPEEFHDHVPLSSISAASSTMLLPENEKEVDAGITRTQCSDWFKEIPKLIVQGGIVDEEQSEYGKSLITLPILSNVVAGLFAINMDICSVWASLVGFSHYPQFSFQQQYIGCIYADWNEGENARMGIGSFKTANKGVLQLDIHVGGQELALALQGEARWKPKWFTNEEERVAILQEVNTYLWASALHEMSVAVVRSTTFTLDLPPMLIPDLQFVEVAVV
ncbi:uncharacterized protein EV420DRAFT_1481732 [Desarmillaria tabescens]|uniref:Uncharacterized protein n=1 Tax=Armillaria tabescens TaxID=1929756 RepID=A0AA39K3P8_ARMTA|nr:uncharacterized protein EV420DRAFT_1481732 [Desarmillaria tabescens]KAK0454011.1 hypothetical protein EV420DRAFT_1481732 [Desarmillaria tabescens]